MNARGPVNADPKLNYLGLGPPISSTTPRRRSRSTWPAGGRRGAAGAGWSFPDDAGMGATPQSLAQAASERIRSGLSPAAISRSDAVSGPRPTAATSWGDPSGQLGEDRACSLISASNAYQRAPTDVTSPGRSAAQRWINVIFVNGCRTSRSSAGALIRTLFKVTIAAVRAFTATSFATLICRIISTVPSAAFGTDVTLPASTARAAFSASRVSDLPRRRRSRRSVRGTSITSRPCLRIATLTPAP